MMKMFNKHKNLMIFGTLIAPIILILVSLALINYASLHFTSNNPIIYINPEIEVSSVDVLSLYLSILGILIGAYLTVGIFAFQVQEQEQKTKSIMEYYQMEILKSLNMIFHDKYDNISIELSHWIEISSVLKEKLAEDDFELLNDLCVKIVNSKKIKDNCFINDYLNDFFIYFSGSITREEFEVDAFLNLKTVTALNSLGIKKIEFTGIKMNNHNKEFYKIEEKNGNYVYSSKHTSVSCNCTFNDGKPFSGFIKEIGVKYYEGKLNRGEREGEGKVVKRGHVLEEGNYVNGELLNGKIYGKRIGESLFEKMFMGSQLYDNLEEYEGGEEEAITKAIKIADYNVINGEKIIIDDSIREIKIYDSKMNILKNVANLSKMFL